jgi:hypothetical protein
MTVPYTFAGATAAIPLSQLDNNFATTITLGNTAIQLGNTVATLNNMTLANVTISSVATAITPAQGGTGLTAVGTSGNVITSNGTAWISQVPAAATGNVTIGNTTISLGGTATNVGNLTLANVTINSVSTAITPAQGGTGLTTLTANNVILGNGTANVTFVAPGTSGNVLTSTGTTWSSTAAAGGGGANVQTFTSSGTWTKPAVANFVMVEVLGAGGGGGSGRRGAAGTTRLGGSGGGGGAFMNKTFLASEIGSKVTVTIGAGGSGAAAKTTNDTSGSGGGTGGQSAFGNYLRVWGGSNGAGGGTSTTQGGGGGGTLDLSSPPTNIAGATGSSYIPGSFGRSFKVSGNVEWPGAGFAGGSGGFISSGGGYGGESSAFGGGGGGSGGWIDTSNQLQLCTKGGGNYLQTNVSGFQLSNYAKGANGITKFGGSGGSSYDGVVTTPFNFDVAAFGNSTFVVVDSAGGDQYAVQTSTDSGVTWTQYRISFGIYNLLWDGSKWVALASDNVIYTTTDFVTWTAAGVCGDKAGGLDMTCIAYYSGTYVAVGNYGVIQTSTDLVAWTSQTSGIASNSTNYIVKVIHDGTKWIAAGYFNTTSAPIFLTSTDAVTWTNLSANLPAVMIIYQVASSGTTYVVGGTDATANALYYSTNSGTTWTISTATSWATAATGAIYAGGNFVFANPDQVYYSTTGATFTLGLSASTLGNAPFSNCLASNGTTYIVCANFNSVYAARTSTNLTSWTVRNAGTGLPAVPGTGGNGGIGAGGGGGGASLNGFNSGGGGTGGNGIVRVYTW